MVSFYDLKALQPKGQFEFSQLKDKVVLIVNTASKCGFTPQFDGLEKLYNKYKDRGFVIVGFPSNQFANQDPGNDQSIGEFCVKNYGVSFPIMAKSDVNGAHANEVFKFLKHERPGLFGTEGISACHANDRVELHQVPGGPARPRCRAVLAYNNTGEHRTAYREASVVPICPTAEPLLPR